MNQTIKMNKSQHAVMQHHSNIARSALELASGLSQFGAKSPSHAGARFRLIVVGTFSKIDARAFFGTWATASNQKDAIRNAKFWDGVAKQRANDIIDAERQLKNYEENLPFRPSVFGEEFSCPNCQCRGE